MNRPLRFGRRRRRGANAIEYALTLPGFLLIIFGMMEYGWYFSNLARANGALAQSCREASLVDPADGNCGDSCIIAAYESQVQAKLAATSMSCLDCSATVSGVAPDRKVRCTADVEYQAITAYLPANTVVPSRINTRSEIRLEWQRIAFP